jgi:hypothetical protein
VAQDFPESMFSGAPAVNHARAASLAWISLEQDFLESFFRGFLGSPAVIRAMLEQMPLREILILEEILGKSAHAYRRHFKKIPYENDNKIKSNLIANRLICFLESAKR